MRRNTVQTLVLIFILAMSSCSSGQDRTTQAGGRSVKEPEKGKVISNVTCLKDPATSYALYLPKNYSTERKIPVILIFDPSGSGLLPVEKYKNLGELYGCILIGSNNSRNGQQMNETENIIYSLFEEIDLRYSIDTSRIYAMGFSGGARIASLIALYRGGIKGVIGCGAGFPSSGQPGRFRFDYFGFAGNADFNMNEIINLDDELEKAGFRHATRIFSGKHEWPPDTVMSEAFYWLRFCWMKDKQVPKSEQLISDFMATNLDMQKKHENQNNLLELKADRIQMVRFLQGLEDVTLETKSLNELLASESYKKLEKKVNAIKEKEMKEQQFLSENFFLKDINWWKNRITGYESRITSGKDDMDVLMCKRIKSYLSLMAYMNYSRAVSMKQEEKVKFSMQVYELVDPENAAKFK